MQSEIVAINYELAYLWMLFTAAVNNCTINHCEVLDLASKMTNPAKMQVAVVYAEGTPYQIGFRIGSQLRDQCRTFVHYILKSLGRRHRLRVGEREVSLYELLEEIWEKQSRYIPQNYIDRMDGVARGADLPVMDIYLLNMVPELVRCGSFVLLSARTAIGTLIHGRSIDFHLSFRGHRNLVLLISRQPGRLPVAGLTFTGMVGTQTGMNRDRLSLAEAAVKQNTMFDGFGMQFLAQEVLECAGDLEQASSMFEESRRTGDFLYCVADARADQAIIVGGEYGKFKRLLPGQVFPSHLPPVEGTVLLAGEERFDCLNRALHKHAEKRTLFTIEGACELWRTPGAVINKRNMLNCVMVPDRGQLRLAVAHSSRQPAYKSRYHEIQVFDP